MKIVSIHQPAYLPWLGYFDKIAKSDIHVFLDDAEYSNAILLGRNKIKTPQGALWLTVPVHHKNTAKIYEIKITANVNWRKKHWQTIKVNYARAPFFSQYQDIFASIYNKEWNNLADLNIYMNKMISELLGIRVRFIKSSELNAGGKRSEKLVNICKELGADVYLSGKGAVSVEHNYTGKPYLDIDMFKKNDIKVEIQEFSYPQHKQLWGEFIPNLSIIDILFNHGDESKKFIYK